METIHFDIGYFRNDSECVDGVQADHIARFSPSAPGHKSNEEHENG
jgi:hypothetical protein